MLDPEPRHRPGPATPLVVGGDVWLTCRACCQRWPCETERQDRVLGGQVPAWTPADEVNLRRRLARWLP